MIELGAWSSIDDDDDVSQALAVLEAAADAFDLALDADTFCRLVVEVVQNIDDSRAVLLLLLLVSVSVLMMLLLNTRTA
jgi:TRAP-type C4-dicarboxylate transport system permease large subunit